MLPRAVWSARKKLAALARALALQKPKPKPTAHDQANPFIAAIMAVQSAAPEPDELAYLWPCNVAAWDIWCDLQSQWRHGMAGPTGLDYAGVRAHLDEMGLSGDERREVYACIRAAERATLEARAELAEQERAAAPS